MKTMAKFLSACALTCLFSVIGFGQNISAKSNELKIDLRAGSLANAVYPKIVWAEPVSSVTFLKEGRLPINVSVESQEELVSVKLTVREADTNEPRGTLSVTIDADKKKARLSREIHLLDGVNEVVIEAETNKGLKTVMKKSVHVGATVLADASKLKRTDYALIFATDTYDNWNNLMNPIFDGRTIGRELQDNYGFKTEVVENPTQEQILIKLREYAEKQYEPLDQLFIFIAGHGFYDDAFKEGFVVTKESLPSDPAKTSYLAHSRIRSAINNNPCEHVFLVMDVCFGGTFDEDAASRSIESAVYADASQSEIIIRKLQFKTRKYLTSGGKEYVSDGIAGKHSPFAKQFVEALKSRGGDDGILTLSELITFVEKLKTAPQFGRFGSDKQGSEFVFVVK